MAAETEKGAVVCTVHKQVEEVLMDTKVSDNGWIDIHAHILPGVDDGAHDWDEAAALLKLAYGQGIRHIIATPHFTGNQDLGLLMELCTCLDNQAKAIADGFGVSLGQEIMYFENLVDYLNQGKALTLAGSRYVLVEFGPSDSLGRIKRAVRQLVQASYFPVIAHVERYKWLFEQERPEELVEYGAYLQMNARSLNGGWMDKKARWCRKNLKKGTIHFIATDMHDPSDRTPDIQTAVSWMEHNMGVRTSVTITRTNPGYILQDRML